jgi:hypothetical protein
MVDPLNGTFGRHKWNVWPARMLRNIKNRMKLRCMRVKVNDEVIAIGNDKAQISRFGGGIPAI